MRVDFRFGVDAPKRDSELWKLAQDFLTQLKGEMKERPMLIVIRDRGVCKILISAYFPDTEVYTLGDFGKPLYLNYRITDSAGETIGTVGSALLFLNENPKHPEQRHEVMARLNPRFENEFRHDFTGLRGVVLMALATTIILDLRRCVSS